MAKNLDELRGLVRARGLRATPSRLAVFELLRTSDGPMSHGEVADRLASQAWDRATIYRNLMDPLRRRALAASARARALALTPQRMAAAYHELYRSLVVGTKRSHDEEVCA